MSGAGEKRRLATILAADVAGYSGLMARDEEATVRMLRAHREVIDKLISRHDGRVFNTAGDAVLAEFGSAVEAVRCAISVQDELRVRNAELIPERQMHFRIGVNVGDVLVQGDDLLGDAVNIAARLEGLASPGGVCISGTTFEQVKNKLSVGFEDLGPQTVKNIPDPVPAFGIIGAPVSIVGERGGDGRSTSARRSLIFAAAILFVIAGVGAAWFFIQRGPTVKAGFPDTFSIERMRASEITALMQGVTISGRRRIDGRPFDVFLEPDGAARYTFEGTGRLAGGTVTHVGRWWAEDFRFCMQIPKFARGAEACPKITGSGGKVQARHRINGHILPWAFKK